ncbi:histidine phosphatase family protein [Candidatus Saganbacteria bacterium]|uniref:Histidine phosphatase family protein n=1 Tax=Candidatus Saganbacteria bacterium TaxID=2575572 RepID=A0A9D6UNQ5_UNCSA|nr:histidine phosphatase family protein [Candidatus Saganbacteria bacterium]
MDINNTKSVNHLAKYKTYTGFRGHLRDIQLRDNETIIIFARHGKTIFTESHKLPAWHPDADRLTEKGKQQAEKLKAALNLLPVTWIASGDARRLVEMVKIIAPPVYGQNPVWVSENQYALFYECLRDINYGSLGGLSYKEDNNEFEKNLPDLYRTWKNDRLNFSAPGGESYSQFSSRVIEGFRREILPDSLGKISLVLSHLSTIREILVREVLDTDISKTKLPSSEAGITAAYFGVGKRSVSRLLLFNNTEHL